MVQLKVILDTRRKKSDGTYPICFRITNIKKVNYISAGITVLLEHWDETRLSISKNHPNHKSLNLALSKKYYDIQREILKLEQEENFSIDKLKNILNSKADGPQKVITFNNYVKKLVDEMMALNQTGNALVYKHASTRFINFVGSSKIEFKQIDFNVLDAFRQRLLADKVKLNSISNYFRTIRAIYNKAIRAKIIDRSHYPFYDISIKTEKTANRAISKKDITKLEKLELSNGSKEWHARNCFLLCFYLIGISFTDLAYLTKDNINNGRIIYRRRKTHKLYSIRLFKKAEMILNLYANEDRKYLLPVLDNKILEDTLESKKLISQWIKTTNEYLGRVAIKHMKSIKLTTYVARHTWATTAKKMGYSNELIAEALGHQHGNRITNIYLDVFDQEVVDGMHEKVIS
ncbi:site-specific integrase [Pedobacter nanyangensis]|uniref:site-specific integrase n=1 Tax=Pedobacter nanyangensis TaxID=1562389 RepID=UPI000DE3DD04|nr:site-specific integrase [Pedobacter nanyangensis]